METLGIRNKNPFNLRSNNVDWLGKVGESLGFCVFRDMELGARAGLINLLTQMRRSTSLCNLVYRYAPPFENDSLSYYRYLLSKIGNDWPSMLHKREAFLELAYYIAIYEGSLVSISFLSRVEKQYHIFDKHLALLHKHG